MSVSFHSTMSLCMASAALHIKIGLHCVAEAMPIALNPDFQQLFESSPGLFLALLPDDPTFTIAAVSDAYLAATMTIRDRILGRPLFEVFPDNPDDPAATGVSNLHASLSRVLSERRSDAMAVQKYDIPRPESQGGGFEERFWSPSNSPVIADGQVRYIIHRVEDVTDFLLQQRSAADLRVRAGQLEAEVFKRAQQLQESNRELRQLRERESAKATADLEKSELRYRTLASATSSIVWTANAAGAFVELQPSWSAYTGQSKRQYEGFGWLDAIHREDRESFLKRWHEAMANAAPLELNARLWNAATSSYRHFTTHGVPVLHASEETAEEWIGTITDIEEAKNLEEQLRHAAKLESLGVLAGGIAHDFNNLLTGIMGNASLAREIFKSDDPEDLETLDRVLSASERAAHLTRQMLAYSGKGRFEIQQVDLSGLVQSISALVQSSIPPHVQLRLELHAGIPRIEADPGQIQQIVMNLIINGAEAVPAGAAGLVAVSTHSQTLEIEGKTGQYVCLTVQDNGTGMSDATKAKIFDPFFTTKVRGCGLGLSAVMGIVRGHKGELRVSSDPGKGTTFEVLFPASSSASVPTPVPKAAGKEGGDGLILLIDDEKLLRRTGQVILSRRGYSVISAADGAEGLEIFRSIAEKISLVILDLSMPVMGGEETLRRLLELRPNLRVILSSGYDETEASRVVGGNRNAPFLKKPFTANELVTAVRSALG